MSVARKWLPSFFVLQVAEESEETLTMVAQVRMWIGSACLVAGRDLPARQTPCLESETP